MTYRIIPIAQADYAALAAMLAENDMLHGDLEGDNKRFFAFEDESGWRVGVGGLELYGQVAILRSFLTTACHRGEGLGARMLEDILAQARLLGVLDVYLFTMDADGFFAKQGFVVTERAQAPAPIAASSQFTQHCRSGIFMHRRLD